MDVSGAMVAAGATLNGKNHADWQNLAKKHPQITKLVLVRGRYVENS